MISTAVCELCTIYKLLSQTLDINARFVLQFVVYCILFTVSIQLFAAIPNKPLLLQVCYYGLLKFCKKKEKFFLSYSTPHCRINLHFCSTLLDTRPQRHSTRQIRHVVCLFTIQFTMPQQSNGFLASFWQIEGTGSKL